MVHRLTLLLMTIGAGSRTDAFAPTPLGARTNSRLTESLADGVDKTVLTQAPSDAATPQKGDRVVIDYHGTIVDRPWSPPEVVTCWLDTQQGVDDLKQVFLEQKVDETKLLSLTEEDLRETMGVENKIKAKKLIMAVKRLQQAQTDYPAGTVFDSSIERGEPYVFGLGQGKAIRGMDLGVASMKVGEKSVIQCRSDAAYGSEGLRRANGDVMVPPYATLSFEVELLRIEEAS